MTNYNNRKMFVMLWICTVTIFECSVKLEYQRLLGAEQCTVSECCREWIDNVIRPDATTLRYR